jgi:hypothetical protein
MPKEKQFTKYYFDEVKGNPLYGRIEPSLLRSVSKESFYEGRKFLKLQKMVSNLPHKITGV